MGKAYKWQNNETEAVYIFVPANEEAVFGYDREKIRYNKKDGHL